MKEKTVIGIIGEQAGGKGAVSDIIIKRYGGTRLTTSNILRRTLDSLYLPFERETLTKLALILKEGFGGSILMEAMLREVEKIDGDFVIVDGIRMPGDTDPFRREYDDSFHLIYVTADQKLRYERSKKRGEKAEESQASFEEFVRNEQKETEKYIPEVGKTADYKIINNKDQKSLERKVMNIMKKI